MQNLRAAVGTSEVGTSVWSHIVAPALLSELWNDPLWQSDREMFDSEQIFFTVCDLLSLRSYKPCPVCFNCWTSVQPFRSDRKLHSSPKCSRELSQIMVFSTISTWWVFLVIHSLVLQTIGFEIVLRQCLSEAFTDMDFYGCSQTMALQGFFGSACGQ